jgi:hypothetical protein
MSEGSPETDWSVNTMSKGNKVVSMRFPKEIIEKLEAEARIRGMSVSELCKKTICMKFPRTGTGAPSLAPLGLRAKESPFVHPVSRPSPVEVEPATAEPVKEEPVKQGPDQGLDQEPVEAPPEKKGYIARWIRRD